MPQSIRVLFMIGSMSGGGSERQLLGMLRNIDRSRFQPFLYLVYHRGPLLEEIPSDVEVISYWDRHAYPRLNFPGRIHRSQIADLQQVLSKLAINVIYERTYLMTLFSAPASRPLGVPRVAAIVSNPQTDLESTAGRFISFKRRLLRQAYLDATHTVAVSNGIRRAAVSYYDVPDHTIETHFNSVDVQRIEQLAELPSNPLASDHFHIVSAGRLDQEKGQIFLLEALADLVHRRGRDQIRLHLLGDGREKRALEDFVESKSLGDFVRFYGHVKNPYPYLKQANLVCLSSLYEGMPNVILEAMACGTPVLSTDCPEGPREVLDGGSLGRLVPPADSLELASAIEDAIDHYAKWKVPVQAAREFVEQHYSQTALVKQLEKMLLSAANRHEGK